MGSPTPLIHCWGYLIDKCPQFLALAYRRTGSRGPAPRLLFDPARIADPAAWLAAHIGDVTILGEPEQPVADEPPADRPAAAEPEPPLAAGCPADGVDWAVALRSLAIGSAPNGKLIPHTVGPASDALICAGIGWDADAVPPFGPIEPPIPPPDPSSTEWEARHAAE